MVTQVIRVLHKLELGPRAAKTHQVRINFENHIIHLSLALFCLFWLVLTG